MVSDMRFLSPFRLIGCQFLLIRWIRLIHVGRVSSPVWAFFRRLVGSYVASVVVVHHCFRRHRLLVLLLQVLLPVLQILLSLVLLLLFLFLLPPPLFSFLLASFRVPFGGSVLRQFLAITGLGVR